MYYDNYYRDQKEETYPDNKEDIDSIFEPENFEIPEFCPYRHWLNESFSREHGHGKPMPPGPPPSKAPNKPEGHASSGLKAVDSQSLRPCLYRYVYIWPRRGRSFWAWLTFVGRNSASGYRWNGRRWAYFGMDLKDIQRFECY